LQTIPASLIVERAYRLHRDEPRWTGPDPDASCARKRKPGRAVRPSRVSWMRRV